MRNRNELKIVLTLTMVWALLLVASPVASQESQRVASGVHMVSLSGRDSLPAQNVAWVEFDDHILIIDACYDAHRRILSETVQAITTKPARFLALSAGNPATDCDVNGTDLTFLASRAQERTEVRSGRTVFPTDVALEDETQRVFLRGVRADRAGHTWTLLVEDSKVLFAGDLVGLGRGSEPLPVDDWILALQGLERLNPNVVVPGNGRLGGVEMLRDTRVALSEAKSRIVSLVNAGHPRDQVIESVRLAGAALVPEGTIESLYDEHVGVRPADAFIEQLGLREGPSPSAADPGWTPPRKVVVADLWPGLTGQLARVAPGVEVVVASDREAAADLVEDADAILGWLTPEILERGKHLRWISLFSAGIESYLTLPGFRESNVVLTNGQSLYAGGGAEHVLGMVLALSRRLHTAVSLQSERRWDNAPLTGPTPITGGGSELGELRGKTLLVVGLGGIGTEVARLAHGIGMRVIATRASRREGPSFVDYVGLSSELLTLVPEADVVVNCVPLTTDTERMFDNSVFSAMKSTAFFVNIGRGKTVDTRALTDALREGVIAGAGLDVTEPEPLPADHELWGLPNVIITPHVGGDSEAHMERIWLLFRENLRRFAVGEPLLSVVNKRRGY